MKEILQEYNQKQDILENEKKEIEEKDKVNSGQLTSMYVNSLCKRTIPIEENIDRINLEIKKLCLTNLKLISESVKWRKMYENLIEKLKVELQRKLEISLIGHKLWMKK